MERIKLGSKKNLAIQITLAILSLSATSYSTANTLPPINPAVIPVIDPARTNQRLSTEAMNKKIAILALSSTLTKPVLPSVTDHIKFKLNQINLTGVTVYKQNELEKYYQSFLGKTISFSNLQQIADNITKQYREDGYIISKAIIPAQKITNGIVTLRVVEGYVAKVNVAGNLRNARGLLQNFGDKLKQDRPLNVNTMERYVLLANDIPGTEVKAVLSPAENNPSLTAATGATDITLVGNQHLANGYLTFDNRGTRFLGPNQYSAGVSLNSLLRSGDQTTLQGLVTADPKLLQYFRLSHQTPLGTSGLTLNIAGSYGVSRPEYTLDELKVKGLTDSVSIGLTYPVIRSRSKSLMLSTNFEMLNSKTDIQAFNVPLYADHIRSLRFAANFVGADSYNGMSQINAQLSQGLKVFGANSNDDLLSRQAGRNDYTKINMDVTRIQFLSNNFSLLAAAQGQYSFSPLLSAEQFSYGGSQFGLAYDPSEISGDSGIAAKVELRYNSHLNYRFLENLQYFTFYDIGKVWNKYSQTLIGATSGASAGIGARTTFNKYLSGSLVLAKPLTSPAGADDIASTKPHIFFSVTVAGDTSASTPTAEPLTPPPTLYRPTRTA